MPNPPLIVEPVTTAEGMALRVRGDLDMVSAAQLRDAISIFSDGRDGPVVLDVADVSFIDSSGINALVGARQGLVATGRGLELHGMSPSVRRVLELSGVIGHFAPPEVAAAD
jgi:anti-anti-sigma factor